MIYNKNSEKSKNSFPEICQHTTIQGVEYLFSLFSLKSVRKSSLFKDKEYFIDVNIDVLNDLICLLNDVNVFNIDKYLYVFSVLNVLKDRKEYFNKINPYIRLYSVLLKSILGPKYKKIIDFLVERGFLEVSEGYSASKNKTGYCKGYRMT